MIRAVLLWTAVACMAWAGEARQSASADHPAEAHGSHSAGHGPAHVDLWKLVNFVLFLGAMGYLLRKPAGEFFRSRTAGIQQALAEAARLHQQAEARCAEIEQRLANLDSEIDNLRGLVQDEAAAEQARLKAQIQEDVRKIQAEAEQEIAAAVKAARQQLRAEAAEMAVELAAVRIRQRLSPEVEDQLIRSTVRGFERRAPEVF